MIGVHGEGKSEIPVLSVRLDDDDDDDDDGDNDASVISFNFISLFILFVFNSLKVLYKMKRIRYNFNV